MAHPSVTVIYFGSEGGLNRGFYCITEVILKGDLHHFSKCHAFFKKINILRSFIQSSIRKYEQRNKLP